MSPSKGRANEVERTPTTNDIVLYRSPAHQREMPDLKRKYMNSDKAQRKEPELTTL